MLNIHDAPTMGLIPCPQCKIGSIRVAIDQKSLQVFELLAPCRLCGCRSDGKREVGDLMDIYDNDNKWNKFFNQIKRIR